jgi:hypothetical protein
MNRSVIRYQTKPEATQQNVDLIQNVFRELAAAAPENLGYCVLRAEDNTFIHIVAYENESDQKQLTSLPAFAAFQDGGAARRVAPPDFTDVTLIANYQLIQK